MVIEVRDELKCPRDVIAEGTERTRNLPARTISSMRPRSRSWKGGAAGGGWPLSQREPHAERVDDSWTICPYWVEPVGSNGEDRIVSDDASTLGYLGNRPPKQDPCAGQIRGRIRRVLLHQENDRSPEQHEHDDGRESGQRSAAGSLRSNKRWRPQATSCERFIAEEHRQEGRWKVGVVIVKLRVRRTFPGPRSQRLTKDEPVESWV